MIQTPPLRNILIFRGIDQLTTISNSNIDKLQNSPKLLVVASTLNLQCETLLFLKSLYSLEIAKIFFLFTSSSSLSIFPFNIIHCCSIFLSSPSEAPDHCTSAYTPSQLMLQLKSCPMASSIQSLPLGLQMSSWENKNVRGCYCSVHIAERTYRGHTMISCLNLT